MLTCHFIVLPSTTTAKSPEQVGRVGHGQRLGEIGIDGVVILVVELLGRLWSFKKVHRALKINLLFERLLMLLQFGGRFKVFSTRCNWDRKSILAATSHSHQHLQGVIFDKRRLRVWPMLWFQADDDFWRFHQGILVLVPCFVAHQKGVDCLPLWLRLFLTLQRIIYCDWVSHWGRPWNHPSKGQRLRNWHSKPIDNLVDLIDVLSDALDQDLVPLFDILGPLYLI